MRIFYHIISELQRAMILSTGPRSLIGRVAPALAVLLHGALAGCSVTDSPWRPICPAYRSATPPATSSA